jgi:hypothetical protein
MPCSTGRFAVDVGLTASGVRPSVERFRRTDASAPPTESLPTPKTFFAKASCTQRLPLYRDRTIFGRVFVRGGMTKFSKMESPPTGGSRRAGNELLVSWTPLVIAAPLAGSLLAPLRCAVRAGPSWLTDRCCAILSVAIGQTGADGQRWRHPSGIVECLHLAVECVTP